MYYYFRLNRKIRIYKSEGSSFDCCSQKELVLDEELIKAQADSSQLCSSE